MAALRSMTSSAAFAAVRRTPTAVTIGRRGYAEAADKIKLSLVLPHQALYASQDVVQVNISAATGDMGILANHAPAIEPLRAGILEVIESAGTSKKFFVSGGFATVHPNNALTINAVEGAPLEDFSAEAVRTNLAEVQRVLAGNGSEAEKAEARIEADVYESIHSILQASSPTFSSAPIILTPISVDVVPPLPPTSSKFPTYLPFLPPLRPAPLNPKRNKVADRTTDLDPWFMEFFQEEETLKPKHRLQLGRQPLQTPRNLDRVKQLETVQLTPSRRLRRTESLTSTAEPSPETEQSLAVEVKVQPRIKGTVLYLPPRAAPPPPDLSKVSWREFGAPHAPELERNPSPATRIIGYTMSLSAADLQKKHALEGTPDPFPSLSGGSKDPKPSAAPSNGKNLKKPQQAPLDTSSESAFPSLGGSSGKKAQAPSAWSATRERVSRPAVQINVVSDTIELDKIDLKAAGRDGKPTTLGEVMRNVMAKSGATIEASTARMTGKTTFIIKGSNDHAIESAKRLLISGLAPVVSKKVDAPASTIGTIIGPKGATLKGIREATSVRVDIPPRNASLAVPADGSAQVSRSPSPHANDGAEEDEATIPITVSGPAPLVDNAIVMIQEIIDAKTSRVVQRVKDIPAHVFPFLLPKLDELTTKAYQENPYKTLNVDTKEQSGEIVCTGDRVVVAPTVEALREAKQELEENLQSITLSMSRAQFPYILEPVFARELFTEFEAVAVPLPDDQAGLMIYGREGLGNALSRIIAKSQERHSHSWLVRGHNLDKSISVLEYLVRSGAIEEIKAQDASVAVHIPTVPESRKRGQVNLELIGDRAPVKNAVGQLEKKAGVISDGLQGIEVDPIVLKVLKSKHNKALEKIQADKNVIVSFPTDSNSSTLIVLHNHKGRDTDSVSKVRRCNEAAQSVQSLIKTVSDIKSETVAVDRKWHPAVNGKNGTTLETIIGEDKVVIIEFGVRGKELNENQILVRGPASEVERAVEKINQVVAEAEQYEVEHSYVTEFTIPQDYVGRVVGSQGSAVNKLRESLDVKIDFNDEATDEKEQWNDAKGRGKKAVPKSKVRIQGKQENAEEAKKRILGQIEKLADETEEKLIIARQYHPGLIGSGGKYVTRMEDNHGVKIYFPRDGDSGKARELKENEVLVKGGKKGVAAAKAELLELVEFEKANNIALTFDVPTRAVARILGKGGASINEIKTTTGASIDVDKDESSPGKSSITVRGTADQTKDAKAAILAIANEVGDEVTEVILIEPQYHRNFIGKGGETLRQLIISAGGPEDPKLQAGLVHFPRAHEPSDEVRLRGDKKLVAKLKKELEKLAAAQRDRVIIGVAVPVALHRALIGRGGQHLNDLQTRTGTQVWFPGSRSYGGTGEPSNADQLGDVAPEDLVKVMGPKAGCEAAVAELTAKAAETSQPRERPSRISSHEQVTRTVQVPLKYHHVIVHQGGFQRSLRPHNVHVDFSQIPAEYVPARPASTAAAAAARIDQDEAPADDGVDWQVAPNYEGAEEGEAEWTLRGRDEASLDAAEDLVKEAIQHAESLTHVGFLTLTDRSAFPRIVGAKGANVSRIRSETGTEITVGKGDNTIVIIGSESGLQDAKAAIMHTVEGGGRGRGRQD
ncbi:hypothetical protein FRB90_012145 [Tulasnella sp. 427]|nr:hypothetical protein FRB90_012145 [Tulasnella sp. 427]